MVLTNTWVLLILLPAAVAVWHWRRRLPFFAQKTLTPIAHSPRITALTSYKAQFARYKRALVFASILVALTAFMSAIIAARPSAQSISSPSQVNRDIIICLDVSGSMKQYNKQILQDMQKLVANFRGQRVGLVMFNSSPITVFPPTDDYDLVQEQMKRIVTLVNQDKLLYDSVMQGTTAGNSASEIGLGILSCVNKLGDNPTHRSQSIILATDNESAKPLVESSRALVLAKNKGIRVYALDPGVGVGLGAITAGLQDDYMGSHGKLRTFSIATGGGYYEIKNPNTIPDVVTQIFRQEAKLSNSNPMLVLDDRPLWWMVALMVVTGIGFIVCERYRLW